MNWPPCYCLLRSQFLPSFPVLSPEHTRFWCALNMASRCQHCATFSIELALERKGPYKSHYHPHYESINDLSSSARSGCNLCQLMVACLKKERLPKTERRSIETSNLYSYLVRKERLKKKQYARFELHVWALFETSQNPLFEEVQLKSKIKHVKLRFRLATSQRMPSHPFVVRADQDVIANGLIGELFNIGNARIGQFREPFVPGNASLARMRLEECLTSHDDCKQHDAPALPDRVIEVTNDQTFRLVNTEGRRAQYIALSHCWGGQVELMLTEQNIAAFRNGLAVSALAENFRDAIKVTRNLGLRYLWIDCLCIIQGSEADWLEQSKKMASVYSHATLTIYAMVSPTSRHGILTRKNSPMVRKRPLAQPVCVNVYKAAAPTGLEAQLELAHYEDDKGEDSVGLAAHSILASRGWTLQEYVLAPRRLLIGTNRVHWECLRGTQTMDGFTLRDGRYLSLAFNSLKARIHPYASRLRDRGYGLREDYYDLARVYMNRQLTFSSDKLPAFSAIARSAHHDSWGDYIAGLWTEQLHRGLAWCHKTPRRHRPLPTEYQAPSWSWAKSNHNVWFIPLSSVYHFSALPLDSSWRINLVDDSNRYGAIQSAQLNLTVWMKRIQFVSSYPPPPQGCLQNGDLWHLDFDVFEDTTVLRTVFMNQGELEVYTVVVNGAENWVPRDYFLMPFMHDGTGRRERPRLLCLVVGRPSDATSETYERMGLAEIFAPGDWQESWPRQSITLC